MYDRLGKQPSEGLYNRPCGIQPPDRIRVLSRGWWIGSENVDGEGHQEGIIREDQKRLERVAQDRLGGD